MKTETNSLETISASNLEAANGGMDTRFRYDSLGKTESTTMNSFYPGSSVGLGRDSDQPAGGVVRYDSSELDPATFRPYAEGVDKLLSRF